LRWPGDEPGAAGCQAVSFALPGFGNAFQFEPFNTPEHLLQVLRISSRRGRHAMASRTRWVLVMLRKNQQRFWLPLESRLRNTTAFRKNPRILRTARTVLRVARGGKRLSPSDALGVGSPVATAGCCELFGVCVERQGKGPCVCCWRNVTHAPVGLARKPTC